MEIKEIPVVLLEIAQKINEAGGKIFLVGGWVRDHLLFLPSKDYDLEIYHISQETLDAILSAYGKPNSVGRAFGITLLRIGNVQYDFAFPRTERKVGVGHGGFEVTTDPNLSFEKAAWRRDFTINAMGISLPDGELVDPYGGQKDLKDRVLRHVSEAFGEDPLRTLRAIQFAARFDLHILPETVKICAEQDLSELSVERIDEEMRKLLLKSPKPSMGFALWKKMSLSRFFPELKLSEAKWEALLKVMDMMVSVSLQVPDELRASQMYATLISKVDKKDRKALLDRLTRHLECSEKALKIAQGAENISEAFAQGRTPSQGWLRRQALLLPLHEQCLLAESLHRLAGHPSGELETRVKELAEKYHVWDEQPEPWLTGKDLIEMGLKPGPHFGNWIQKAFDLQLDGLLKTRADALNWMKRQLV